MFFRRAGKCTEIRISGQFFIFSQTPPHLNANKWGGDPAIYSRRLRLSLRPTDVLSPIHAGDCSRRTNSAIIVASVDRA